MNRRTLGEELSVIETLASTLKSNERFHNSLEGQVDAILTRVRTIKNDVIAYDNDRVQLDRDREVLKKERNDWDNTKVQELADIHKGDPTIPGSIYTPAGVVPGQPTNPGNAPSSNPFNTLSNPGLPNFNSDDPFNTLGNNLRNDPRDPNHKVNLGNVGLNVNSDNKPELDKIANRELPAEDLTAPSDTTSPLVVNPSTTDNEDIIRRGEDGLDPETRKILEDFKDR